VWVREKGKKEEEETQICVSFTLRRIFVAAFLFGLQFTKSYCKSLVYAK
jgi:hypothetical protein